MNNNFNVGDKRLAHIFPMNGNNIMPINNIYKHQLTGKQNYKRFAKPKQHELLGYMPRPSNNKKLNNKKPNTNVTSKKKTLRKYLPTLHRKLRTSNYNDNTRHGDVRFASWYTSKKTRKNKQNARKHNMHARHKKKSSFDYSINNNIESQLSTRRSGKLKLD